MASYDKGRTCLPGAAFWFAVENSDFMCYNFLILVYSMQMGGKEGVSCPLCNQKSNDHKGDIEKYEIRYRSFSGTFYISPILYNPQYIFIDTLF